jgi:nicotinamide phosphoribosyltransferase
VVTEYVTELKSLIMVPDGKLVCRPEAGDPVKIICGDASVREGSPAHKGAIECLWDVLGGTMTEFTRFHHA